MGTVKIETGTGARAGEVMIKLGGLRIAVPIADYQAMLAAIDTDLAELHKTATANCRSALNRLNKSYEAMREFRAVLYEREGDYFLLRHKPDDAALTAFLDKYAALFGFEP